MAWLSLGLNEFSIIGKIDTDDGVEEFWVELGVCVSWILDLTELWRSWYLILWSIIFPSECKRIPYTLFLNHGTSFNLRFLQNLSLLIFSINFEPCPGMNQLNRLQQHETVHVYGIAAKGSLFEFFNLITTSVHLFGPNSCLVYFAFQMISTWVVS